MGSLYTNYNFKEKLSTASLLRIRALVVVRDSRPAKSMSKENRDCHKRYKYLLAHQRSTDDGP